MIRHARLVPALAWMGLIFWLSSQPSLPSAIFLFDGIDKVFHAGAYGVLGALLSLALGATTGRAASLAVVIASLYGVSDELHQYFVPGRSCDVFDWMADTGGAAVVVGMLAVWQRRLRGAREHP
jgi:VanZ family protein